MPENLSKDASESDGTASEQIRRHAAAFAEATVYSMNNTYLTKQQKAYVEAVYQLPIGAFGYIFLGYLAFIEPLSYLNAVLFAALCNVALSIPWWFAANTTIAKVGFLFAGRAATFINLGFAAYFGHQGTWPAAGIAAAAAFGLLVMITPSMWIYGLLGRGMNPKYRIAKKLFGIKFPFENDLIDQT